MQTTQLITTRVAIQGGLGSFHHVAGLQWFDQSSNLDFHTHDTFDQVFADLMAGSAEFALVAVENTLIGSIVRPLDLLALHPVTIIGEVVLHIHHQLLAIPGASLADISQVSSQTQALDQCRTFLQEHPTWQVMFADDTAKSVEAMMAQHNQHAASIASRAAGERNGAIILAKNIESNPENYTRFFVLKRQRSTVEQTATETDAPGDSPQKTLKTSLAIAVKHQPGSLANSLQVLAYLHCNLTRIESRPIIGKPWEYLIFIDMEHAVGHPSLTELKTALAPYTTEVTVFGTYSPGEVYET